MHTGGSVCILPVDLRLPGQPLGSMLAIDLGPFDHVAGHRLARVVEHLTGALDRGEAKIVRLDRVGGPPALARLDKTDVPRDRILHIWLHVSDFEFAHDGFERPEYCAV